MKLNKTEQKILAAMERDPRGQHSECASWGAGPGGGRINSGSRGTAACRSLIKKGLAEEVVTHHGVHYSNGYGEHYAEIVIKKV